MITKPFYQHDFIHAVSGHRIQIFTVRHIDTAVNFAKLNHALREAIENGSVVHHEGVKGAPKNVSLNTVYAKIADQLGFEMQKVTVPFEVHDATWEQLSIFSKLTIRIAAKFMNWIVRLIDEVEDSEEREEVVKKFVDTFEKGDKKNPNKLLMSNLGGVRERIAVTAALFAKQNVAMVWGSAHSPSFMKRLNSFGYEHISSVPIAEIEEYDSTHNCNCERLTTL